MYRVDEDDDDQVPTGAAVEPSAVKVDEMFHERDRMPPPRSHDGDWSRPNELPLSSSHPRSTDGNGRMNSNSLGMYEESYSPAVGGQYQILPNNSFSQLSSSSHMPAQSSGAHSSEYVAETKPYVIEQPPGSTPLVNRHGYPDDQRTNDLLTPSAQTLGLGATSPTDPEADRYVQIVPANAGRFSPVLHHTRQEAQCPYPSLSEPVYHMSTSAQTPTHVHAGAGDGPATPHALRGSDQVDRQPAYEPHTQPVDGRIRGEESYAESYPKPAFAPPTMALPAPTASGSIDMSNGYQTYSMAPYHHNSGYHAANTAQSPSY